MTPPLIGGDARDPGALVAIASEMPRRPVTRSVIVNAALRVTMTARGMSEPAIRIALGLHAAGRASEFGFVDPAVERPLGRKPITIHSLIDQVVRGQAA